jgi:hypothetical protein
MLAVSSNTSSVWNTEQSCNAVIGIGKMIILGVQPRTRHKGPLVVCFDLLYLGELRSALTMKAALAIEHSLQSQMLSCRMQYMLLVATQTERKCACKAYHITCNG